MSIIDKKGINVTSGFKLVSGQPIDARFVVEDETELESLITNGAVYEGLHVWVKSLGKEKVWNGTEFADINFSSSQTPEDDNVVIQQIDTNSKCIKNVSDSIKPYSAENSILNFCNAETRTNKIYFNINLSNEEVEKILGNLFDNNEQKQNWENTYYLGGLYDVEGNLNLYYDIIYFEGDNGEKFFAFEQYDSNNDSTYYNVVWCNEKGKEYINSNYNTNILNSGWQLDYQEYWFDTNMSADYWRISAFKIVENFMALSEFNDVFAEENTIYDIGLKFDLYLIDHNGVISKYDDYIKNNSYYKINWIVADKIPNNNIMPFYGENNTFNIYIVNYRFYGYFPDENNFKIDTDILNWALNEWTEKYFGNNMILFKRNFNDLQELINKGYDNLPAYALIPKNKSNLFISNGEKFERIISESNIFAIKDVESLPMQNNISGTQLQVDGSLPTKIYFNLNATDEDILPILQELQNVNDGSYMGGYAVTITPNFNGQLIDSNLYDRDNINICYEVGNDKYIIGFQSSRTSISRFGGYEVIWASQGCNAINSNIKDGWQDWIKNLNGVLDVTSEGTSYLTANSEYYIPKLKDIISSTEFKVSEGPAKIKNGENKNIFYRTSDQKIYYVKNKVFEELSNEGKNFDSPKLDLCIKNDKLNIVNNGVEVGDGIEVERLNQNIVEMETLPEPKLVGNVIPGSGEVGTIYFNNKLSVEKMLEIFRSITYTNDFTGSSSKCYYITAVNMSLQNNTVLYFELNGGSEDNGYNLILLPPSGYPNLLYHLDVNEMTGSWYLNIEKYEANINVITSTLAGYIGQIMQNEKLTELLSLGEFNKDYSEVANKNTIYKVLEDDSYKIFNGETFVNLELENIIFKQTVNQNDFDEIKPFSQEEFDKIRNNLNTKIVVFKKNLSYDRTMVFTVSDVKYSEDNLIYKLYFSCLPNQGHIAKFYLSVDQINNNSTIPISIIYFPEKMPPSVSNFYIYEYNKVLRLSLSNSTNFDIPMSEFNSYYTFDFGRLKVLNGEDLHLQNSLTLEDCKKLFKAETPFITFDTKNDDVVTYHNFVRGSKCDDFIDYILNDEGNEIIEIYRTISFLCLNTPSKTARIDNFIIIDIKCKVDSTFDLIPTEVGTVSIRELHKTFYQNSADIDLNIDYSNGALGEKSVSIQSKYNDSILYFDTINAFIKMPNATTYNTEVILVPNSISRSNGYMCYNDVNFYYENKFYKLNKIRAYKPSIDSTYYIIKCNLEVVE